MNAPTTGFTKLALKCEQDGTPVGQPHDMYLDCRCGFHLPMHKRNEQAADVTVCPQCGKCYDPQGWILSDERSTLNANR